MNAVVSTVLESSMSCRQSSDLFLCMVIAVSVKHLSNNFQSKSKHEDNLDPTSEEEAVK